MLNETPDMAVPEKFFRSAKAVTGVIPDRVTTDGHDSYPRAIRSQLGAGVRDRNSQYLSNRIGFGAVNSAARFCRCHDELRNLLHANYRFRQFHQSPLVTAPSPSSKPHRPPRDGLVVSSTMKKAGLCGRPKI
jgi:hypothetical protein